MWTKTSLPPSSLATKPKPLVSSNHLTLPPSSTAVEGSGCARRGGRGFAEGALRSFDDAGGVDLQHPRDLCALGAGADDNLQLGTRRHRIVARGVQRVGVEEGVALAVGQLDEAVALVGLEPLDDGVDRRTGRRPRCRHAAAHRRRAEAAAIGNAAEGARRTRFRLVGHRPVVVEAALARRSKVLTLAHVKRLLRPINSLFRLRNQRDRRRRTMLRRRDIPMTRE